jgi:type I restriction enzyme S subunit
MSYFARSDELPAWVGDLPDDWKRDWLKWSVRLSTERPTEEEQAQLPYISNEDIASWTGKLMNDQPRPAESDGRKFQVDDVLLNKLRPYLAKVYHADFDGVSSGELLCLRPSNIVLPRFLFYVLVSKGFIDSIDAETFGSKMPRADWEIVGHQPLPLPPLETQRRIAQFLDEKTARIDGLIEKKRALLDRLAEKRQALITRAVTKGLNPDAPMKPSGIDWLGDIPAHWEVFLVKRHFEVTYGVGGEIDRSLEEGTNLLSLPNISKDGRLKLDDVPYTQSATSDLLLRKGDLIFNWRNGSTDHLGKTVRFDMDGDWTHVSFLLRLRAKSSNTYSGFLRYFLNGLRETEFFAYAKAGVNNTFNLFELKNLPVVSPPTATEQKEIADYIDDHASFIDKLSDTIEHSIARLDEYRAALITDAVTGQIEGLQ